MKQNERDVILWLSTWKVWCGVLCGSLNWSEKQLLFEAYNGTPLQYPCLENPMDGGAWLAAVHGVAKSRTRLSNFPFTFHFYALEKEMATHSSVLAWRIPGTGEPGGLPTMGSHRVGHNWSDLAAAAETTHPSQIRGTAQPTCRMMSEINGSCLKHSVWSFVAQLKLPDTWGD